MPERAPSNPRPALAPALVVAVIVGALLVALGPAEAHTPHDDGSGIALSPTFETDRTIWVISGNRLLRSTDAGLTWEARVLGLPRPPEVDKSLSQVAIVRDRPEVLYVTSRIGGILRSDDGGDTWRTVGEALPTDDLNALAVSPTDPERVLVAGSGQGAWLTVNGGWSWQPVHTGFVSDASFAEDGSVAVATTRGVLVRDPDGGEELHDLGDAVTAVARSGDTLFAGTASGAVHRADGAAGFREVGAGLPEEQISDLEVDPSGSGTIWAMAVTSGVHRSDDGGDTFRPAAEGLTTDEQADEVGVSQFRRVVAGVGPDGHVQLFAAGFDGIFRSDDGGQRWRSAETLSEYVVGLDVSPEFGTDRTVAAVTYVKGAYVSTDGGDTWMRLNEGIDHDISAGNKVAQVRRLHNIVVSPTFADDGLLFSATWTTFLRGTVADGWEEVRVAPPPEGSSLRQFVMGLGPDFAASPTIYLGTRQGTVYRSQRAGEEGSWEPLAELGSRVRTIVAGPGPDDERVLYASTVDGVRRSDDGGATWEATGPDTVAVLAMSPAFATDGTVFAGTESGLFATRDDGRTWDELDTGAPRRDGVTPDIGIEAVAVSPDYPTDGTVLVSVTGTGLFRSSDGGERFEEVGTDLTAANHVIADFTNPTGDPIQFSPEFAEDRTVFAYADQHVLRSTDAGDTWEVLSLPPLEDFLLATDPSSLDRIVTDVPVPPPPEAGPRQVAVATAVVGAGLAVLVLVATSALTRRRRRRT